MGQVAIAAAREAAGRDVRRPCEMKLMHGFVLSDQERPIVVLNQINGTALNGRPGEAFAFECALVHVCAILHYQLACEGKFFCACMIVKVFV